MTTRGFMISLAAVAIAVLPGCSGNDAPSCSLKGGTELAASAWPKFRADAANSGRAAVDMSRNTGIGSVLFPPTGQTIGPAQTTPVLGPESIFLGSSDTNVYVLGYDGEPIVLEENIQADGAVTGTPLLGADGTLFVPSNGTLAQYRADGTIKNSALLQGFAAASPNIWSTDGTDGTAYVGTLSGGFSGVCPNGVPRYQLSFPATQSSAAVTQDPNVPNQSAPIVLAAGLAGQVRAYNIRGRQRWSFFASDTINAAVMIDDSTGTFYVADAGGRVYAGAVMNGTSHQGFSFAADAGITASPALGRDTAEVPSLYVADDSGTLYALDRATGAIRWTFRADGPIQSSPAVATGGDRDVIVFGADVLGSVTTSPVPVAINGRVYALRDDGNQATVLWQFDTGTSIGASSPSIGTDGTVYIGRQGQRLGVGAECPGGGNQTTCTVNDGGALYAIGAAATGQDASVNSATSPDSRRRS